MTEIGTAPHRRSSGSPTSRQPSSTIALDEAVATAITVTPHPSPDVWEFVEPAPILSRRLRHDIHVKSNNTVRVTDAHVFSKTPKECADEIHGLILNSASVRKNIVVNDAGILFRNKYFCDNICDNKYNCLDIRCIFVLDNDIYFRSSQFVEEQWSDRLTYSMIDASGSVSYRLHAEIITTLKENFGYMPKDRMLVFDKELRRILAEVDCDSGYYIDHETQLMFYPVPIESWEVQSALLASPGRGRKRDPIGFLQHAYRDYIEAGLLYSGHIHKVDPMLYTAIKNSIRTSDAYDNLVELFADNGVITPVDLEDRDKEHLKNIQRIKLINARLAGADAAGATIKAVATHSKRAAHRRVRSLVHG